MGHFSRRRFITLAGGALVMPRFVFGQSDNRPQITIAVQQISTSNTLDPLIEQSNVGMRIMNSYAECLIGQNLLGKLQAIPRLATGWKRIDDKTVELELRKGVLFHNGDEMTAEDVAFTFGPERMFGDTTPQGWDKTLRVDQNNIVQRSKTLPPQVPAIARRLWPSLLRVEAVDTYTVRFVNAIADVTMEGRIMALGSQIINRRAFEAAPSWLDFARRPIGTGPYRVEKLTPDTELVLVSHDRYWGGLPPLRQIRFVQVPEAAQRVNGIRAGQYDMACDLTPDQFASVTVDPGLEIVGGIINNIRVTCFDKYDTVLKDPRIRQAMLHGIDRQAIVNQLWMGKTIVPNGDQFEWYGSMYLKDWRAPQYDPAMARQLLKQAGYQGEPIPYRLLNDYYTLQVNNAQVMTEMWKQVGLNVQIEMKENWAQVWEPTGKRGIHDWSSGGGFPDPVATQPTQWGPQGQAQQAGEYHNDEVNQLCGILQSSTDPAQRLKAFWRMLAILERDDPAYGVINQNATFTARKKTAKWQASPSFAMDFRPGNWG
ncbi:ABC transporter substrate-binding protein [Martelella alba]|uniref:ABC transporter substrate-binding protein n=1 Tax=Martelella alba TaxID=2590451 RepID=A0ABY2SI07_9HYPH|nr:ABC transporter substrate-binding protein [Martelella alba]TKI03951.1 ABC transporter substrate-binding protein [Martelella alba]